MCHECVKNVLSQHGMCHDYDTFLDTEKLCQECQITFVTDWLNRSLGEFEGPIRDPVLARFPKVAAFSSAESGSDEPPDRAQICPMSDVASLKLFFSEPILGPPNVDFSRENGKMDSKQPVSTRHTATNCAKRGSGTNPRQKS